MAFAALPIHRKQSHAIAAMDFQREECGWVVTGYLEFVGHGEVSWLVWLRIKL
jgi:hypothetical protein